MSSEVKRYDFSVDSSGESITETSNGRFVLCSNYAALARECEALRAAADDAHGLLTIAYMDGYHEGHKTCTDHSVRVRIGAAIVEAKAQKRRAEAAEAKLQRIMEWARGRCECCANLKANPMTCRDCMHREGCVGGLDYWTPPQEWEGE